VSSIKHQWNHFLKEGHFWASVLAHNADTETNERFLLMLVEPSPCSHTWQDEAGLGCRLASQKWPGPNWRTWDFQESCYRVWIQNFWSTSQQAQTATPSQCQQQHASDSQGHANIELLWIPSPSDKQLPKLFVDWVSAPWCEVFCIRLSPKRNTRKSCWHTMKIWVGIQIVWSNAPF